MAEIITFPGQQETLMARAEQIGWEAVRQVTERYGDGSDANHVVPSEHALAYHNARHTTAVQGYSQEVAAVLQLSDYDTAIAVMAASAHDLVHGGRRGEMERRSADWLMAKMESAGFDAQDREIAELAVLGTEPTFSGREMTGQKVTDLAYPSARAELIARVVACADMAHLYAAHGPLLSRDLYKEYQGVGPLDEPPLNGLEDFQLKQIKLAVNYRFPLAVAETLFAGLRSDIVWHHVTILEELRAGKLTSWQQVLAEDQAFLEQFGPSL